MLGKFKGSQQQQRQSTKSLTQKKNFDLLGNSSDWIPYSHHYPIKRSCGSSVNIYARTKTLRGGGEDKKTEHKTCSAINHSQVPRDVMTQDPI